jgi:flagellar basal-body rod protein FlgG
MWTAAAGASAQAQNLDVIANNLANSDTPAFKKDMPTFKEYLATTERVHIPEDIPRGPIKDKEFYPLDGRDQSYVVMDGTHTSFRQGNLRVTQGQLDIALDGPGFLEVSTPKGIRFTRQGSLKVLADGKLATSDGFPVLSSEPVGISTNIQDPQARMINLRDRGGRFVINELGEIYAGGELVGRLSVSEFRDSKGLHKIGSHLFENLDPTNRRQAGQTVVRQGVLETSNVNPIEEMTQMIQTNRLFEADLKSLKTYGELLGKEANEIGKL